VLIVGCLLIGLANPAIAQSNNSTTANSGNSPVVSQIDETVTLVEYNFNKNSANAVLRADYSQNIKICDMYSAKGQEGVSEFSCKSVTLDTGENNISVSLESNNGWHGFSIATSENSIGVSKRTEGFTLSTNYEPTTVAIALMSGLLVGIALVGVVAIRLEIKYSSNVERQY
jgi:hypothetical protein